MVANSPRRRFGGGLVEAVQDDRVAGFALPNKPRDGLGVFSSR